MKQFLVLFFLATAIFNSSASESDNITFFKSPDNRFEIVCSRDYHTVKVSNCQTGKLVYTLEHIGPVANAIVTTDNKFLITYSYYVVNHHYYKKHPVKITDLETGKLLYEVEHDADMLSALVSPDNKFLVTSSYRAATLKITDFKTGNLLHTITGCPVAFMKITSDNELFIINDLETPLEEPVSRSLNKINLYTGKLEYTIITGGVTISSDDQYIAHYAYRSSTVNVINLKTGKLIYKIQHNDNIESVTINPNNKFITTKSKDSITKRTDLKTGKFLE